MAHQQCPFCAARFRSKPTYESHLRIHRQIESSALPQPSPDPDPEPEPDPDPEPEPDPDPEPAPAAEQIGAQEIPASNATQIDPFDIGELPEFETSPTESGSMEPDEYQAPAFDEGSLSSLFVVVSQTTASMAHTGPAGELSEAEGRLLATLSLDYVNRTVRDNFGGDPATAKMAVAVGIILASKAKVYYSAIRSKPARPIQIDDAPAPTPEPAPPTSPQQPEPEPDNGIDLVQGLPYPKPPPPPKEIRWDDEGGLEAIYDVMNQ